MSAAAGDGQEFPPAGVRPEILSDYAWLEACGFDAAKIEAYVAPREGTKMAVAWPEGVFLRMSLVTYTPFPQRRRRICEQGQYVCCGERLLPFARLYTPFHTPSRFIMLYGSSGGIFVYDVEDDCVYLLGVSVVSFCRDGLRGFEPVYRDGLVLPRVLMGNVMTSLVRYQRNLVKFIGVVRDNAGSVFNMVGQLSGVDSELLIYHGDPEMTLLCGGRTVDLLNVTCSVVRRLSCAFEIFGALGYRPPETDRFHVHLILLIDHLGTVYSFEPRCNRLFRLADDFETFLRLGSQKAIHNFRFHCDDRGIARLERPPFCPHHCSVIVVSSDRHAQLQRNVENVNIGVGTSVGGDGAFSNQSVRSVFGWPSSDGSQRSEDEAGAVSGGGALASRDHFALERCFAETSGGPPPSIPGERPLYVQRSTKSAFALTTQYSFGEPIGHIAYCGFAGRYFDPSHIDPRCPEIEAIELCVRYDAAYCARVCYEGLEHVAGLLWQEELDGLLSPGLPGCPPLVFDPAVREAVAFRRRGLTVPDEYDSELLHEALRDPACRRCIERRRLMAFRRDRQLRASRLDAAYAAAHSAPALAPATSRVVFAPVPVADPEAFLARVLNPRVVPQLAPMVEGSVLVPAPVTVAAAVPVAVPVAAPVVAGPIDLDSEDGSGSEAMGEDP